MVAERLKEMQFAVVYDGNANQKKKPSIDNNNSSFSFNK